VNRRIFLGGAAISSLGDSLRSFAAVPSPKAIIDCHVHLFDVSRPQGVPWPSKDSGIYKTSLPDRYQKLAAPHGVVGAMAIECSPWLDDNQWVLDVTAKTPIIVGTIGNLSPGTPEFRPQLERLHRNRRFRGIRNGNLWERVRGQEILKPGVMADLKLMAAAGLVLDTANLEPALLRATIQLTDQVPDLRIIIDHLPSLNPPGDPASRKILDADLRQLAARPQVFAKISAIVRRVDGRVPLDISFYRERLDHLWEVFGPDRLMYGSDWPNSDQFASYDDVFRLAQEFISSKDRVSIEKFYWQNSLKAYRWIHRDASQAILQL
jgi:L-fuconolactonase